MASPQQATGQKKTDPVTQPPSNGNQADKKKGDGNVTSAGANATARLVDTSNTQVTSPEVPNPLSQSVCPPALPPKVLSESTPGGGCGPGTLNYLDPVPKGISSRSDPSPTKTQQIASTPLPKHQENHPKGPTGLQRLFAGFGVAGTGDSVENPKAHKKPTAPQYEVPQNQDRGSGSHLPPNQHESRQYAPPAYGPPQDFWRQAAEHYEPQLQRWGFAVNDLREELNLSKQRNSEAIVKEVQYKETINQLRQELRETQADHAHLRKHLQLGDPEESGQIVNEFKTINRTVEDVARNVAEESLRQWPFEKEGEASTADVHDIEALKSLIPQGDAVPSILFSKKKTPRSLEDVLDYGLRSIVSKVLDEEIFFPFHPSLALLQAEDGARRSGYLKDLYGLTRLQEPQVVAGRWRASTYKALDSQVPPDFEVQFANRLVNHIINGHILPFVGAIFGPRTQGSQLPPESELYKLLHEAVSNSFKWNRKVKLQVVLLDFVPFTAENNAPFDPKFMEYFEKPKRTSKEPTVICAGSIGLRSYVARGGRQDPEERVQEKIKVLTTQFFGD